ncbi:hypothetical protein [Dactylosporangium sp. NPDC049140]|uniref:hypothetical protein n=1 Tax=Dactylosporangium sp. NPDC049140 TaxID=3155647 RepID=UPI00340257F6
MSATVTYRDGSMNNYAVHLLPTLVAQLDAYEDDEHPDIAVSHESGWTLSAFPSGLLVWENVDADGEEDSWPATPRHLREVPRERLPELLALCADGQFDELERLPWRAGNF